MSVNAGNQAFTPLYIKKEKKKNFFFKKKKTARIFLYGYDRNIE